MQHGRYIIGARRCGRKSGRVLLALLPLAFPILLARLSFWVCAGTGSPLAANVAGTNNERRQHEDSGRKKRSSCRPLKSMRRRLSFFSEEKKFFGGEDYAHVISLAAACFTVSYYSTVSTFAAVFNSIGACAIRTVYIEARLVPDTEPRKELQ